MIMAVAVVLMFLRTRPPTPARSAPVVTPQPEQAVIVYLGRSQPAGVSVQYDLTALEDRLIEVIETGDLGEYDGQKKGPEGTVLSMSGADAEHLFRGVERVLRDSPLCAGARVVIRRGGEGAPQRELRL
jgi:hypothetical protein